ncbi:MAG: AraC family transcriptional regulator [Gammaproteobacteria bacterium]|nr:AraC family transcriptional regulator [Gammaproteobacteria bacterium]MBQ0840057.1 AraC family transcriptional regulator [Gammaproteobacteria bacterium]
MSPLNDLTQLLRLQVSIYHNARVCGDWKIASGEQISGKTCFHMATQGGCLLSVPGYDNWVLAEGDLVIFPREIAHSMVSQQPQQGTQQHLVISQSQNTPGTSMLCGEITFANPGFQVLLDALPEVFVIQRDASTPWLTELLNLILAESLSSETPSNPLLDKLCELLFAYGLRHFIEHQHRGIGIVALFTHPRVARAVSAIHAEPGREWGLLNLAEEAQMSRTQFAQTFKQLSGWTAMQYLTWWRMQIAWSYLEAGEHLATVAEKVGYRSESAFSRAFQKSHGTSAGAVRRGRQTEEKKVEQNKNMGS